MKCFALCLVLFGLFQSVSSQNFSVSKRYQAASPPRGWNSYDAFSWIISEQEFLQNAEIVSQRLRVHGYEYVVVDYLWYRKFVNGANSNSLGFDVIDEWGRMVPDPARWPSSNNGKGFSKIAKKVHKLGLKFGIHIMRGISTQAVNANTPILDPDTGRAYEESGRVWHAKDIAIPERTCKWMSNGFMSVNTTLGAGRAFLKSLHLQYADWGVDLVKHDCVFGEDLDINEITYVSLVLSQLKRPITYSLSPGPGATPAMAKQINGLVNMYRVTGDDWDKWSDVKTHFDVARDFSNAKLIGANGLNGKSWPDLDMLPFGWITDPGVNEGPHRYCSMTQEEQKSQLTLWAISKSPLMYGGDLRMIDPFTFRMITDPILLEINSFSLNNKEFPYASGFVHSKNEDGKANKTTQPTTSNANSGAVRSWVATGRKGELYLAFFNLSDQEMTIKTTTLNLDTFLPGGGFHTCQGTEVWTGKKIVPKETQGIITADVGVHGCAIFAFTC